MACGDIYYLVVILLCGLHCVPCLCLLFSEFSTPSYLSLQPTGKHYLEKSIMNYVCFAMIIIWNVSFPTTADPESEDKFPNYPFYLHAQVRKKISTEHVPVSFPGRLQEILVHTNQEVHEERGYVDSTDPRSTGSESRETSQHESHPASVGLQAHALPSKILEFASSHLYDQDAHRNGIYKGRSRLINCPDIGIRDDEPNADSKGKMAKAYMACIKRRYFGDSPLPPQIFAHPAESRRRTIKMGSMEDFMLEFRTQFNK